MTKLALSIYWNNEVVMLEREDIRLMRRFSAEDDKEWGHDNPKPYTEIRLKQGAITSAGVGSAFVSEEPEQIRHDPSLIVQ